MWAKFKEYDLYRRIPKDLTETTTHGTILSICASIFMLVLFIAELWAFLSLQFSTNVVLDPNTNQLLKINFNITVLDIPCEYATIDVVDVLGTRNDNVTVNINKWTVDANGLRRNYEGRNLEQRDLQHDMHHDLEMLHSNGVHATPLDEDSFNSWLHDHEYTFVNFYAPWCIWCQRLEPVWEAFAEKMIVDDMPVSVIKVDCISNRAICADQKIQAFPNLRLFKHGEVQPPDYRSDRTIEAFSEFINSRLAKDEALSHLLPHEQAEHLEKEKDIDHPGCMMSGILLVNRVPGNFHIQMRSKHHNINPPMANLSHIVNSMSFGPSLTRREERLINVVPEQLFSPKNINPMDSNIYINRQLHQAYHHYIKVVSTHVELSNKYLGSNAALLYQMVQSSQNMMYEETEIPEARFSYDISPMAVVVTRKGKHWYEFITSMCALIGGTFTVVGLISGFLNVIFKPKKI